MRSRYAKTVRPAARARMPIVYGSTPISIESPIDVAIEARAFPSDRCPSRDRIPANEALREARGYASRRRTCGLILAHYVAQRRARSRYHPNRNRYAAPDAGGCVPALDGAPL